MSFAARFTQFWGKARPLSSEGPRMHPLWMHSLDVAATGRTLLRCRPDLARRIADALGWAADDFIAFFTFALALHDLGKFSRPFQAKAPACWPVEALGPLTAARADPGHAGSGLRLLTEELADLTQECFPGWTSWELIRSFLIPVVGHHGRPVVESEGSPTELFGRAAAGTARDYVEAVRRLLAPPALPAPDAVALARQSWLLAGLAVLADWIGSNQTWFEYQSNEHWSLDDYWAVHATRQAEAAITGAGIPPAPASRATGFQALTQLPHAPTPVQAWAESVAMPDGALLILIEDMTGSGKTEAALVLAHRLMAAGRARGLYFALPTMATANAMFGRLQDCYRRMFAAEGRPSLVLSHGRTRDDPRFRASIIANADAAGSATGMNSEETDSASECPAWLADDRRKAFLADIGAGTIDQALLAALPAKYQSLRLLGLSERVLIIDEAHAYDAYMGTELDRLVAFQAALGGHSVILSATLPAETKRRLADAYYSALGRPAQTLPEAGYPGVTLLSAAGPMVEPKPPRADLRREIAVARIDDIEAAVQRIAAAAGAGAAVAWIRNSVDDAIAAQALLRDDGMDAGLFHARFAFGDRYAIEEDVVRRFGKRGGAEERRGRVLVATQVVEQSLDLDFDLIVSDLAPIDLLLQRAGRLWRHPGRQRPIPGPELAILSPDPHGPVAADWVKALLPRTGSVYADHLLLWRSAQLLFDAGRIRVPEDVKALVEGAYGPGCDLGAPDSLACVRQHSLGAAKAERSHAEQNLLRFEPGYSLGNDVWLDEKKIMTRLGEETRILRLARWDGTELTPWCDDPDPRRAWALSEVTVRNNRVSGVPKPTGRLQEAVDTARQEWGRYDEDKILLPLVQEDNGVWKGGVLDKEREVPVEYAPSTGLVFRKDN